jgi:hypothetical protein
LDECRKDNRLKFYIPPEVMAGIIRRFYWRLSLIQMSRELVDSVYDRHFLAVSAHRQYPRDTQTLSLRTVAKILDCTPSAAQDYISEHKELVQSDGVCNICRSASSELGRELRRQLKEAEGGDLLVVAGETPLMVSESNTPT